MEGGRGGACVCCHGDPEDARDGSSVVAVVKVGSTTTSCWGHRATDHPGCCLGVLGV